jgi:hypothetical protein
MPVGVIWDSNAALANQPQSRGGGGLIDAWFQRGCVSSILDLAKGTSPSKNRRSTFESEMYGL